MACPGWRFGNHSRGPGGPTPSCVPPPSPGPSVRVPALEQVVGGKVGLTLSPSHRRGRPRTRAPCLRKQARSLVPPSAEDSFSLQLPSRRDPGSVQVCALDAEIPTLQRCLWLGVLALPPRHTAEPYGPAGRFMGWVGSEIHTPWQAWPITPLHAASFLASGALGEDVTSDGKARGPCKTTRSGASTKPTPLSQE